MKNHFLKHLLRSAVLWVATWTLAVAAPVEATKGLVNDQIYTTTPLMSSETQALVKLLQMYHYNRDNVTPDDYGQLVTEYMSDLDPQHLFFTAQDEAQLRKQYSPRLLTDLEYLGNIDAAFAIFRLYEERVHTRTTWILAQLEKDIDLTAKEAYSPDRTKAPWPANMSEADELWRRRLKYEMIPDFLAGKTIPEAKANMKKRHERLLKNLADIDASDIQEAYLTSLTKMYDPHSAYFSPDSYEDFGIQMRLSLTGIGAVLGLDDDGYCVVREIVPGAPVDLSKQIKVNDKILSVRQDGDEPVDIYGMKLRKIVDMIRGKKATHLTLMIQSPDVGGVTPKAKEVTLVRDDVKLNSSRASASIYDLPGENGATVPVGVITLKSFYGPSDDGDNSDDQPAQGGTTKDVAELLGKLKASGIKALVIDLRVNGGGLLSEAVNLTGLFIGQGAVVQVRNSGGQLSVDKSTDPNPAYDGPLAVLTSRFSASASEIFAGALQNYGRAIIVGDSSTHGKGTVQAMLPMKNFIREGSDTRTGGIKLTIQKFYLPNGASTQKKGVIPDVTLPSIDDYLPYVGESSLPHALLWDEIKSTPFIGQPLAPAFVAPIVEASHERQQNLEEFALLRENVDHFKMMVEKKDVSLNLMDRRSEKKEATDFKKHIDGALAQLAKNDYPHRDIKLSGVVANDPEPTPPKSDDPDAESEDADTSAKFDIFLRETLRVVVDAARLSKDPQYWANGNAPLTPAASKHG
ncbi:MAG TPA: carboxy terminal-processing peptidase [Candidatus Didemnitutus sp.]|nr:carboxy terminal-processing peptidase [Candidatus Didemnitutus sp.]